MLLSILKGELQRTIKKTKQIFGKYFQNRIRKDKRNNQNLTMLTSYTDNNFV